MKRRLVKPIKRNVQQMSDKSTRESRKERKVMNLGSAFECGNKAVRTFGHRQNGAWSARVLSASHSAQGTTAPHTLARSLSLSLWLHIITTAFVVSFFFCCYRCGCCHHHHQCCCHTHRVGDLPPCLSDRPPESHDHGGHEMKREREKKSSSSCSHI